MAALIIPSRRVWQPQGKAQIDRNSQIGRGLREALVPSGSHLFYAELGRPLRFAGTIQPVVISGQFGAGIQNSALSGWQEYIGAISIASDATLAVVGRVPSSATNSTAAAVGQTASGSQLRISIGNGTTAGVVRAEAYIGGGTRVFGGSFTLPVGSDYIAIARHKNGVLQDLWVNGIQDPATLSQTGNFIGLSHFGRQNAIAGTPLFLAATWQRALSDQEIRDFSLNPWQIFRPVQRRVYFDMGAGGGVTLTGANCAQSNTSTSGAISQTHSLSGASVAQSNTSTTGAIGQSIILTGASVSQGNASTSGAVSQTHVLIGANCQQANTSTSGAVVQTGDLTGANCAQGNTTTTGAISQSHVLIGAPVAIDHIATASSIVQTHILSGADCSQSNYSTTGSINQVVIPSQFVASVPAGIFSARAPSGEYSATVPAGIFKASI